MAGDTKQGCPEFSEERLGLSQFENASAWYLIVTRRSISTAASAHALCRPTL